MSEMLQEIPEEMKEIYDMRQKLMVSGIEKNYYTILGGHNFIAYDQQGLVWLLTLLETNENIPITPEMLEDLAVVKKNNLIQQESNLLKADLPAFVSVIQMPTGPEVVLVSLAAVNDRQAHFGSTKRINLVDVDPVTGV